MEGDFNVIVEFLKSVASAGGPWAMLGVALAGCIRLLQLSLVQRFLGWISPKLVWANWPEAVKFAVPFVAAFGAALIPALLGGTSLVIALGGAIVAAIAAVGTHGVTKQAGTVVDSTLVAINPQYQPGVIRQAVSPILPVDESVLKEKLLNPIL